MSDGAKKIPWSAKEAAEKVGATEESVPQPLKRQDKQCTFGTAESRALKQD
jgi:hypothetical protein